MKLIICFVVVLLMNLVTGLAQTDLPTTTATTEEELPRYEVGVQFTSLNRESGWAGVGGRFTYNFNKYVAAEAESNIFPAKSFDGRSVQALFGIKVGKRWNKIGVFGKVRPGFIYASEGNIDVFANPDNSFTVRKSGRTDFALDTGGVLEVYPSKKIFLRFDAGTITTVKGRHPVNFIVGNSQTGNFENQLLVLPTSATVRLQFSAGIGFRF